VRALLTKRSIAQQRRVEWMGERAERQHSESDPDSPVRFMRGPTGHKYPKQRNMELS
jgi:hypothetical protein